MLRARIDLHAHLDAGGREAMAAEYERQGFDALIGTDHVDEPPEAEYAYDYTDLDFDGPILNGAELSQDHHVCYIEDPETGKSVKQINHPMRYDDTADDINNLADKIGADLVEICEHAHQMHEYPELADVMMDLKVDPVITSDAHAVDSVGEGYVTAFVPDLTGEAIIEALKQGHYAIGGPWGQIPPDETPEKESRLGVYGGWPEDNMYLHADWLPTGTYDVTLQDETDDHIDIRIEKP